MSLQPAFPDAYTDPNITFRNPPQQTVAANPPIQTSFTQVPVYSAAGTQTSGFSHTDSPPFPPNYWARGRDPYANGGATGQPFFNNNA